MYVAELNKGVGSGGKLRMRLIVTSSSLASQTLSVPQHRSLSVAAACRLTESDGHREMERVWLARLW